MTELPTEMPISLFVGQVPGLLVRVTEMPTEKPIDLFGGRVPGLLVRVTEMHGFSSSSLRMRVEGCKILDPLLCRAEN